MSLVVKTLAFILIVPGLIAGFVPLALVWWDNGRMQLPPGPYRLGGLVLLLGSGAVYLLSLVDLTRFGQGIPAPVEPTQFLVRNGLYRHVRNPMYIAAILFLFAEAVLWAQGILLVYAACMAVAYHLGVVYLEEPALRRRFGASYEAFCAHVPRWLPRLTPWGNAGR